MTTITDYKNSVCNAVSNNTLDASNWVSSEWKQLAKTTTQEVLDDAFQKGGVLVSLFPDITEVRSCKNIARIQQKILQAEQNGQYFRVICDFTAVRINCEVDAISKKIDDIRKVVLAKEGVMYVRGASDERPYGFFMTADGKYTDITQYMYLYIPEVEYIAESQIGHEFAAYTFAIDSELRNNKNCGKVDMWTDDFYNDVKNYILRKANNEEPGSKETLWEKARKIHEGAIPLALQEILERL